MPSPGEYFVSLPVREVVSRFSPLGFAGSMETTP